MALRDPLLPKSKNAAEAPKVIVYFDADTADELIKSLDKEGLAFLNVLTQPDTQDKVIIKLYCKDMFQGMRGEDYRLEKIANHLKTNGFTSEQLNKILLTGGETYQKRSAVSKDLKLCQCVQPQVPIYVFDTTSKGSEFPTLASAAQNTAICKVFQGRSDSFSWNESRQEVMQCLTAPPVTLANDVSNNSEHEQNEHKYAQPDFSKLVIAQRVQETPTAKTVNVRSEGAIDGASSKVLARSTFVRAVNGKILGNETQVDGKGIPIIKKTHTDDKVVLCYRKGLPITIVVDVSHGDEGDRKIVFDFIDGYVTPLMDGYAEKLEQSSDVDEQRAIITDLIKEINALRKKYCCNNKAFHPTAAEFTMAIAIAFQKDNKKYCAGFSIGDCGLVLERADGTVEQLAHNTKLDGIISKDAFSDRMTEISGGIDTVIARNEVFAGIQVNENDKIIGYTSLPHSIEKEDKSVGSKGVKKFALQEDKSSPKSGSLFDRIKRALDNSVDIEREFAKSKSMEKRDYLFRAGDDTIVTEQTILSQKFQDDLAARPDLQAERLSEILDPPELIFKSSEHDKQLYEQAMPALTRATYDLPRGLGDLINTVDQVRQQIDSMRNGPAKYLPMLIKSAHMTAKFLTGQITPETYQQFAEQVENTPYSKFLGRLMIVVGVVAMAVGALMLCGSIPTGAAPAAAVGGTLIGVGLGLFAFGGRALWKPYKQQEQREELAYKMKVLANRTDDFLPPPKQKP